MNPDLGTQVAVIGGVVIANIAVIIGGWVAMKVSVAELSTMMSERDKFYELKFQNIQKDVNNLGSLYRSSKPNKESENE